jgi:hypothetical protein
MPVLFGSELKRVSEMMSFDRHALTVNCLLALLWVGVLACNPKDDSARGATGESCASRSDCESTLVCLDNRCLPSGATSASKNPQADGGVVDTRGSAGESCTRRADCALNLLCIANQCVETASKPSDTRSPLGDRGESCQAHNDCANGLACVMNRCVIGDNSVVVQAKQCFRVQCELDEDCCKTFIAPLNCPTWKTNCAAGDMTACTSFNASCMCSMQCQNSACVPVRKCANDMECSALGQRCFGGKCAQCGADADCMPAGQHCISNVCRPGCTRNEQCPQFSECKSSECVQVGCKSDRECYFATKNPLAHCKQMECIAPCETDAQCGDLQACDAQRCKFVGCETNDECRVFLNLNNQTTNDRAVCRLPDH